MLKTVASLTLKTFLVADPLLARGRASVENVTLSPVDQRFILTLVLRYCLADFSCLVIQLNDHEVDFSTSGLLLHR